MKVSVERLVLGGLLGFALFSTWLINRTLTPELIPTLGRENHLSLLAGRMLEGKLWLAEETRLGVDVATFEGRQYLYLGPLAPVLLMPAVLIWGVEFPQLALGLVSLAVSLAAAYSIARKKDFLLVDGLWLAIFWVFSTSMFQVSITDISTYLAQAVGTTLVLVAVWEYVGRRRWWVMGLLVGVAGMTRLTLFASVVYFGIKALGGKETRKKLLQLSVPVALSVGLVGGYNWVRFGKATETGYQYNETLKNAKMQSNLAYGFVSVKHIPANLYVMLVKAPEMVKLSGEGFVSWFPFLRADEWGMALWFTSPLLLYLINVSRKGLDGAALVATLVLAVPVLMYFGIGMVQFGYRYSLDFLVFVWLVLLGVLKPKLPAMAKVLIVIGVVFNCLYYTSLWGFYPHFFGLDRVL